MGCTAIGSSFVIIGVPQSWFGGWSKFPMAVHDLNIPIFIYFNFTQINISVISLSQPALNCQRKS